MQPASNNMARVSNSTVMAFLTFLVSIILSFVLLRQYSAQMRPFVTFTAVPKSSSYGINSTTMMTTANVTKKRGPSLKEQLHLIREENLNVSRCGEKIFSHFLSHIPKTGASYAFHRLNQVTFKSAGWQALNQTEQFRGCDQASMPTWYFHKNYPYERRGTRCRLWMSERPPSGRANHVYTIVRNPHAHVLSQYFHCKESKDHSKYAYAMPSLDEWLKAWTTVFKNSTAPHPQHFKCPYNPINHQSRFVAFDPDKTTKDDLRRRYDVIGDQAQMDKTVCVMYLRYSGFFPQECNCSTASGKRQLIGVLDHGVKHHGNTFNVTAEQEEAISMLTKDDAVLFDMAREVFAQQVREIEEEFQVTLCEKIIDS